MIGFAEEILDNGYMREREVDFADCDKSRRMRIGSMLSWAAVTAGYDYNARGLTYEVLLEKKEVFLLSRLAMHIHRYPVSGEILRVHTWENGVSRAQMQRVYEFRTRSEEICVSIKSDWILVDPITRSILRPDTFTARPIMTYDGEIDCPEPMRLRMPKDSEPLGTRIIRWSDLDGNGHLFSGNYGNIIWDALPPDLLEKRPCRFFINYSKEATLGEELTLCGRRDENRYLVEGRGPEGICFIALAEYDSL